MQIGIMDGTIVRPTLSETLDAVVDYGISCMQFGLGRIGRPELPEQLDEMGSPHLKVCMDGTNIFHAGELPRMREILDKAFALVGSDIAIGHAKDLDRDGQAGHLAAGKGLLDYDRYLLLLNNLGFDVPLILHGLSEAQVPECVAFLREKMQAINP